MTRLGFGCASLGSRVSAAAGLRTLACAHEVGVDWYDVAPSYGDGNAESILGKFLAGRRDTVSVCTKVGISPPSPSLPKRLLRPLVRGALSVAPSLRQAVRDHRPAAIKPPLDAAAILPSLEASLVRLNTEYVDVLALHEATAAEVTRDDVLRTLESVLASGKARKISIASTVSAARAGVAATPLYGAIQLANNPYEPNLAALHAAVPPGRAIQTITHTVFGASGMAERLAAAISASDALAGALRDAGYAGNPRAQAIAFLPDFAFATNPDGVVLMSMFGAGHLNDAVARIARAPDRTTIEAIAALIAP